MKPLQPKFTESLQTVINSRAGAPVHGLVGAVLQETSGERRRMESGALEQGKDRGGVMSWA